MDKKTYGYYVNLDERGSFNADVRDRSGKSVYEVKAGDELKEGESSIFEDGFMKHKDDLVGLTKYLREMGVIEKDSIILDMMSFESEEE